MKLMHICGVSLVLTVATSAQSDSSSAQSESPQFQPPPGKFSALSDRPGAQELADLFFVAGGDVHEAVDEVVLRGISAVPGLAQLLSDNTIRVGETAPSSAEGLKPDKIYAVMALEQISGVDATTALVGASMNSEDINVRGLAIRALARTKYSETVERGDVPSTEIVRALIENFGIDEFSPYLRSPIGDAAREGIVRWLGKDFGDVGFKDARMDSTIGRQISPSEYALRWYEESKRDLTWNRDAQKFEVK